ncbi:MAG: minor capsid protein [Firmicutes bacterium]|nr:minor capsid protein [Bacillota bacterium]
MLIQDIAAYLEVNGVGAVGADIFFGHLPDQPECAIALYPTGGFSQDLNLDDVRLTAQVLVRGRSYQEAYEKVWRTFNLLDRPADRLIVANGRKMVVKAMQPPFFMNRDEANRFLFAFNVMVDTRRDQGE